MDVGFGNGWVVRKMAKYNKCSFAAGVDGSVHMIAKAKSVDEIGIILSGHQAMDA